MKQTLNLKTTQQLTLSPQLQQAIRLLQMSTAELNEEIERALEGNPLLEKGDGDHEDGAGDGEIIAPADIAVPTESTVGESEIADENDTQDAFETAQAFENEDFIVSSDEGGMSAADEDYTPQYASGESLREHLLGQLALTPTTDQEKVMVQALIDELDDDGYLTTTKEAFCEQFYDPEDSDDELFDRALKILQSFEPSGVGARDLSECLVLQLEMLPRSDVENEVKNVALAIAREHLPDLAKQALSVIRKALGVDISAVQAACQLIRMLNPKPGNAFMTDRIDHIIPDVIVFKRNGSWRARINEAVIPKIGINSFYARLLSSKTGKSDASLMPAQLQEARWLIRNIRQRFDTILRVSQVIVERQQRFFDHGPIAMQPMILRDVAGKLSLHESTISRVTTQKYMLTPQGVFELKHFFGSHVATSSGGAASSTAIRALIKQIVNEESPKSPFSDQQITEILAKEGIMVARRTVAKYRESLSILPTHQRRNRF
ncbi:MAG: RNA polymerase factor sigma-54 [Burkholderiales bacterium]|jgi:RNA polymerase sigma-54 factor|nr:RNA polymerase factor sigma-54 [Burkholderiales bacterium]